MAYTTINKPQDHFNIKLYTGNASTNAQTGVGFQPDWLWFKNRVDTYNHHVFDVIRGVNKQLQVDSTGAESTYSTSMTSFDSDGFTLGNNNNINYNGNKHVAWCWKAGGTASSNSNGSVTSTVSANTTAGFSIVKWTGTGSVATVGHGLSSAPTAIIIKNYSRAGENWRYMNIPALGNTTSLQLDNYGQTGGGSAIFNDTSPTSTVFTVGTAASVNYSGSTMIAYCFHNVRGYQKVGNYNGNGNANGVFVYCGFKPAWILTKNKEADEDWKLHDIKRDGYNRKNDFLQPSNSGAESGTSNQIDIVANGFKIRNTNTAMNANNDGIPYIAIADRSLVGSNGVPTLAR